MLAEAVANNDHAQDTPAIALSDRAAAEMLSMSRSAFRELVRSGRAPSGIKLGRLRRWRADELRAWLEAGAPARHKWNWPRKDGQSETKREGGAT